MKKIINVIIGSSLAFLVSTSFADTTKTDLKSKWNCTTNASTANTDAGKAADEKRAKDQASLSKVFAAASKNCRDCTQITCNVAN
ncbi:MAG: hypothetical protein H0U73_00700 [Tatlockia sp.]|nr:hypothetical protein [Tatlockia sp.]